MSHAMARGYAWPVRAEVIGPCDEIEVLDATWQGAPEWHPADRWVATEAPDLVYAGPPFPGLMIRVGLRDGERLTLEFARREPDESLNCVFRSELILGEHGLSVYPGSVAELELPQGNYPVSVWVDAGRPEQVRRCAVVLGERAPRRLGPPKQPPHGQPMED